MREMIRIGFEDGIPLYAPGRAYGFLDGKLAFPRRLVSTEGLFWKDAAVCVAEGDQERFQAYHPGSTDYDFGGMILRVELAPGAYDFEVVCMGGQDSIAVSIGGMQPERIAQGGYWDAGKLVPVRNRAFWEGESWRYSYVNGTSYVDISLEPLRADTVIGIREVHIKRHEFENQETGVCSGNAGQKMGAGGPDREEIPSIFILGDSTAKSYVFEEAPMSGWGQLFFRMIDAEKARVVNYSNGGRSLRVMHQEGRFNDLLLSGKKGDYVLLQSGHNDERDRNEGADPDGEHSRFGRGSTEEMYYGILTRHFLPAIRAVGMIPVLVTPVTRINAGCGEDTVFRDSFQKRKFPAVMRRAAADTGTLLLDLNRKSVEHFNEVGPGAAKAMVMSLEPGETPGKTNGGSYANGNPGNHADGTHYKECLSRQYCRMVVEELERTGREENFAAAGLWECLTQEAKEAALRRDFSKVFPEICKDTVSGRGAYYRNQIEKMVELGVFHKDEEGNFHPLSPCDGEEFLEGIRKIWKLPAGFTTECGKGPFLKKDAACILYDAYGAGFGWEESDKPPYMTDYNGKNIDPTNPDFDVNLPSGETMYYPLTEFGRVTDLKELPPDVLAKLEAVYRLGLMRCEGGIERGSLENGVLFLPNTPVTREKAAKYLYFCFVLGQKVTKENHRVD